MTLIREETREKNKQKKIDDDDEVKLLQKMYNMPNAENELAASILYIDRYLKIILILIR